MRLHRRLCLFLLLATVSKINCKPQSDSSGCLVEETGSGSKKPCVFPFKYRGITYNKCTFVDNAPSTNPWCSTKTESNNDHIGGGGFYGDCLSGACPVLSDDTEFEDWKDKNTLDHTYAPNTDCTCVPYRSCNWSKDYINNLSELQQGSKQWKQRYQFFRERICEPKKRNVYCCEQKAPDNWFLDHLRNPIKTPEYEEYDSNDGRWKPSPDKFECGERSEYNNIVGGSITKLGEITFMALLGYEKLPGRNFYTCGGSIINKFYVLTAAHCITDDFREVLLGEYQVGKDPDCTTTNGRKTCAAPAIKRKPAKTIVHENYEESPPFFNDIALVRLDEAVPLFLENPKISNIIPVCLPWKPEDPGNQFHDDDKMLVTGWGRITNNRDFNRNNLLRFNVSTRTLQKLSLPIANNNCSTQYIVGKKFNFDTQFCAGGELRKDSCSGDSGGPGVMKKCIDCSWFQVGVVSFGTEKCGVGDPGVYSKVAAYLPWISDNLAP